MWLLIYSFPGSWWFPTMALLRVSANEKVKSLQYSHHSINSIHLIRYIIYIINRSQIYIYIYTYTYIYIYIMNIYQKFNNLPEGISSLPSHVSPYRHGQPLGPPQSRSPGPAAGAAWWCWWHPNCRWTRCLALWEDAEDFSGIYDDISDMFMIFHISDG